MAPTFNAIKHDAWDPLQAHTIIAGSRGQARGGAAARLHVQADAHERPVAVREARRHEEGSRRRAPTSRPTSLIPAFVISELKTAFQIGFLIFLPFLVIDLIVASTLMSMGMVMLPPVFISLPFKILLFVLVDGWSLVTESLVRSFH